MFPDHAEIAGSEMELALIQHHLVLCLAAEAACQ
jgi:hypothetical protein